MNSDAVRQQRIEVKTEITDQLVAGEGGGEQRYRCAGSVLHQIGRRLQPGREDDHGARAAEQLSQQIAIGVTAKSLQIRQLCFADDLDAIGVDQVEMADE